MDWKFIKASRLDSINKVVQGIIAVDPAAMGKLDPVLSSRSKLRWAALRWFRSDG